MEIWGLCPACREWFPCDEWFDQDAPLPCCPSCGRSPSRVDYREKELSVHFERAPELWLG